MESPHKKPWTISDIKSVTTIKKSEERARLRRIDEEFARGFDFIDTIPKSVSIFGASTAKPNNPNYIKAQKLAGMLVSELGYAVITGGGPGIMEAANRGAAEAGGISAGLTIQLPTNQKPNPYMNKRCDFHYFFTRKVVLSFAARIYIFFPGGYGTLNEFFEIITLIQTNKIQSVPIVCVGAQFWSPLEQWMNEYLLIQNEAIDETDLGLFTITDNEEMVLELAQYAERRG